MIFLIEYDRDAGELFHIQTFENREEAVSARLELEIELLKEHLMREVVLLEAESVEALRNTHSRYFKSAGELAEVGGSRIGAIEMEDAAKVRNRLSERKRDKAKISGTAPNKLKHESIAKNAEKVGPKRK